MRISDWSSDLCSSDLHDGDENVFHAFNPSSAARPSSRRVRLQPCHLIQDRQFLLPASAAACPGRSEEHTSELQSLMRISYAVFCLKKKKYNNTPLPQHTNTTHQEITHKILSTQSP